MPSGNLYSWYSFVWPADGMGEGIELNQGLGQKQQQQQQQHLEAELFIPPLHSHMDPPFLAQHSHVENSNNKIPLAFGDSGQNKCIFFPFFLTCEMKRVELRSISPKFSNILFGFFCLSSSCAAHLDTQMVQGWIWILDVPPKLDFGGMSEHK